MMIEEITEKIIESRNNDIAKAFTLHISSLLLHNGIVPLMTEYTENDVENIEDTDEYKIVMEYGVAFKKLDCTEHDKKVYNKAIDDFVEKISLEISESLIWGMIADCFKYKNMNDTSDKIVDYVIDTVKETAEQLKVGGKNGC